MLKKLLIAGGIVIVIIVAAVSYLASNLDSIVAKKIESLGPEMTGVSVKVKDVELKLADGRGEIQGLFVGIPKGYKESHTFRLGSILLVMDPATVTKDVIVIKELTIKAPDIIYEKGAGGSNVEVIQRNVDQYVKSNSGGDKAKKGDAAAAQRFIVEKLQITEGKVEVAGVARKDIDVALPTVSLRDVGKSRGGMTGAEIANVVIKQMTDGIVASAARALREEGGERAKEAVKGRVLGR